MTPTPVNVVRTSILQRVEERLQDLEDPREVVEFPIINLHGIPGIGKTYVVRQLYAALEARYTVVWLGFDPAELKRTSEADRPAIMPLAEAIAMLEQLPALQGQLELPEDYAAINVFCRVTPIQDRPLLLLLDALDDLPLWKWVQEAIIKPLCEQQRTVVVCTSQSPLFWDYWELRDQCEEHLLDVFDTGEIRQYLEQRGLANLHPLIDTISDYTNGYPLAVSNFADEIVKQTVSDGEQEARRALLDTFSDDEWKLLGYIGVVRLAECGVMRELLRSLPDQTPHPSLTSLTTLLKKLQQSGYLRATRQDMPKQIAPELREAIKQRIAAEAPGRYALLCEKLEEIYFGLASEKPKTAVHACIEWLYFSSELPLDTPVLKDAWQAKLNTIVTRAIDVNTQVIKHAQVENLMLADASLAVLFYRDRELIEKLNQLNLFHDVDTLIQQFLSKIQGTLQDMRPEDDVEIREITALSLRIDFNKSCSMVLTSLRDRLPVDILPDVMHDKRDFNVQMRTFLIEPDDVDVDQLRIQTSGSLTFLSPRQLNEILAVFNSRGLLSYDRSRRTYRFHPLIKHLVTFVDGQTANTAGPLVA